MVGRRSLHKETEISFVLREERAELAQEGHRWNSDIQCDQGRGRAVKE